MLDNIINNMKYTEDIEEIENQYQVLENYLSKYHLYTKEILDNILSMNVIRKTLEYIDNNNITVENRLIKILLIIRDNPEICDNNYYLTLDRTQENIQILIENNLNLVKKIASSLRYHVLDNATITIDDLISAGTMGLIRAVHCYDETYKVKFSTYAYKSITRSIQRELLTGNRIISLPARKILEIKAIIDYISSYYEQNGKYPTSEEICEKFSDTGMTQKDIDEAFMLMKPVLRLDREITTDEEGDTMYNMIADSTVDVEEEIDKRTLRSELKAFVDHSELTESEKTVLIYRLGLFGVKKLTIEELTKLLGVSSTMIQNYLDIAIRKLSKTPGIEEFAIYVGADKEKFIVPNEPKNSKNKSYLNLFERFPKNTREEVLEAVSRLQRSYIIILQKRFGPHFTSKTSVTRLTTAEFNALNNKILKLISNLIKNPNYKPRKQGNNLFEKLPEYPKEIILEEASKLTPEQKEILVYKFGSDYTEYNVCDRKMTNLVNQVIKCLKIRLNKRVKEIRIIPAADVINIFDYLGDYDTKKIISAIRHLNECFQKLLQELHGKEYTSSSVLRDVTINENNLIRKTIIPQLIRYLSIPEYEPQRNIQNVKTLFERLKPYTKEQVLEVIAELEEEERKILIERFGENYDSLVSVDDSSITSLVNNKIIPKIKRRLKIKSPEVTKQLLEGLSTAKVKYFTALKGFINIPYFCEYIKMLPNEDKTIVELAINMNNKGSLSVGDISKIIKMSEAEIENIIKQTIYGFMMYLESITGADSKASKDANKILKRILSK